MYKANDARYDGMQYVKCGRSGLRLPPVSLGLWHNFGSAFPYENMKQLIFTAFDNGITHFDLANNYGPVYGSAETNFGRILRDECQLQDRRSDTSLSEKWTEKTRHYDQRKERMEKERDQEPDIQP